MAIRLRYAHHFLPRLNVAGEGVVGVKVHNPAVSALSEQTTPVGTRQNALFRITNLRYLRAAEQQNPW